MNDFNYLLDGSKNPLAALPPVQRFQLMSMLGIMWTLIFCIGTGAWLWFGELAVAHVAVAAGFLITGLTFRSASNVAKTYRDHPRTDGTPRYDDVWGA